MENIHQNKLLTPNEVAEMLHVSPTTIRVWAQKGELEALTTPGGHRRFNLDAVMKFARGKGMKLQADRPAANMQSKRILIIDDDIGVSSYLVDLLEMTDPDYEMEVANYSFDAGLKVRSFKPDIVLLDLMMPGMDGFQVCQSLKNDAVTASIRIIAMTGYPSEENVEKIMALGAEACIAKPVNKDELLKLVAV